MSTSASGWKAKCGFLDKREPLEETINGETIKFYASSMVVVVKLRGIAGRVGKLVATLLQDDKRDTGSTHRRFVDPEIKGEFNTETIVQPLDPAMAKFRLDSTVSVVSELIDLIGNVDNIKAVGEFIMDSMRDVFPRGSDKNPPAEEFMREIELPELVPLFLGAVKANKGVFGPLDLKLHALGDKVREAVESRLSTLGSASTTTSSGPAEPAESPSPTS